MEDRAWVFVCFFCLMGGEIRSYTPWEGGLSALFGVSLISVSFLFRLEGVGGCCHKLC